MTICLSQIDEGDEEASDSLCDAVANIGNLLIKMHDCPDELADMINHIADCLAKKCVLDRVTKH